MSELIDQDFQDGLINMKTYLKRKRKEYRQKGYFGPPLKFARLSDKHDPRFHLSPDELEWYYPASKNVPDWTYEGDHVGKGNEADIAFLDKLIPTVYPDRSYFQEDELPFLLSLDTPLQYPPIHFIRKFVKPFIESQI